MRVWVGVVLASLLVAGCSGSPKTDGTPDGGEEFDVAVEATETTGVIRGVVYDETITPLANANVTLAGAMKSMLTSNDGEFGFQDLEPGTYFFQVEKLGFKGVQQSAEVVAGIDDPDIVKVMLVANPSTAPYVEAVNRAGYLSFGAAIFATSIGTTVWGPLADTMGDSSIWTLTFAALPLWAQGELVWDQTQPLGGEFIWEMTDTSNNPAGYRETTASPALAYWNTTVIEDHNETTLDPDRGIAYRFFGGPHPLCKEPENDVLPFRTFGCGITLQQKADAYIHNFYNFVPAEGWRFTEHGEPEVPR